MRRRSRSGNSHLGCPDAGGFANSVDKRMGGDLMIGKRLHKAIARINSASISPVLLWRYTNASSPGTIPNSQRDKSNEPDFPPRSSARGWNDDGGLRHSRSEEHTSELQSLTNLVC